MRFIFCLSLAFVAVGSLPITKEKLRFKVSAKGLPDKDDVGTIDPYVEIFYTESGSDRETKLGRSDTINDNENPDWGTIFEFDFDRNKNQRWHFKIWDYDNLREDDKGGQVWIDVVDYVDKGQIIHANLDKQGYITVKSVDATIQQRTTQTPGSLPFAPNTPEVATLTFKLSANGLPDKDNFGRTDPYVEIFSTDGLTGKKVKVGRSNTLSNTKNPSWGESFTFSWNRRRDQRLFFKIYDNDNLREDDTVGKGWIEVNDYVAKGQVATIHLNKRGTLTITRADGLPPNPYNPAQIGASQQPPAVLPYPVGPNVPPVNPNIHTQNLHQPNVPPPVTQPNTSPNSPPYPVPVPPNPNTQKPQQPTAPIRNNPVQLRFKLSGSNFPDKDIIGTSDPYAKVFIVQDGQPETLLKKGTKLSDNENPQWPDIYEFNYDPSKHQKLRFLILDEDDNRRDDEIGNVSVDASQIEQKNVVSLSLPQGTLTITKI